MHPHHHAMPVPLLWEADPELEYAILEWRVCGSHHGGLPVVVVLVVDRAGRDALGGALGQGLVLIHQAEEGGTAKGHLHQTGNLKEWRKFQN